MNLRKRNDLVHADNCCCDAPVEATVQRCSRPSICFPVAHTMRMRGTSPIGGTGRLAKTTPRRNCLRVGGGSSLTSLQTGLYYTQIHALSSATTAGKEFV